MITITENDILRQIGEDNRGRWEEFVHRLIIEVAPCLGIQLTNISRDSRTDVGDGGVDISISSGAARPNTWIPCAPSIWSVKSGKDGLKPTTIRKEVEKRPHIINHLKADRFFCYVIARPSTVEQRDRLREAANKIAAKHGFSPDNITIYALDHLRTWLEQSPLVIASHFPEHAVRLGQNLTAFTRSAHCDIDVPFVEFGNRQQFVEQVRAHLLGNGQDDALLHVAGISGIGKTRIAIEASRTIDNQGASSLYYSDVEKFESFLQYVSQNVSLSARVVVDDVSIEKFVKLQRELRGYGQRLRVVSIGHAHIGQQSHAGLLVLSPPAVPDEVDQFLQSAAGGAAPSAVVTAIRNVCESDLRLALMLMRQADTAPLPTDPASLLKDSQDLIEELLRRRLDQPIPHKFLSSDDFEKGYKWLTLAATIGFSTPRKAEIQFVAKSAGQEPNTLKAALDQSVEMGLGRKLGHLYSAVPRGLAVHIFSRQLWPYIRDEFREILDNAPTDDFRRAILDRAEECASVRGEVQSMFDDHFRCRLGQHSLTAIESPDAARTLRSWVELSPSVGLAWLGHAVNAASLDQLRDFRGSSALGLGAHGPRREVVWLLENLSCFALHYQACEEMLFKLACAENEDVGNSATEVWKNKLRIYLSNSEIPFEGRVKILLQRLATADTSTAPLILKGLSTALSRPLSTLAPPRVIGGRLTPPEWRPSSEGVYPHFVKAIIGALAVLQKQSPDVQQIGRDELTRNLGLYCKLDTFEPLKDYLGTSTQSDGRVTLVDALDRLLMQLRRHAGTDALIHACEAWRKELQPRSLVERIKLEYQRGIWGHARAQDDNPEDWRTRFGSVADELNSSPDVLNSLQDWLAEREDECSFALGTMLATKENGDTFKPTLQAWMARGRCRSILSGYFNELRRTTKGFPDWAVRTIEALSETQPALAAQLSADNDPSERGLACVKRCISANPADRRAVLTQMATQEWERVLGAGGVAWLLGVLWPATDERDPVDGLVALNLLDRFALSLTEGELPKEWLPIGQRLLEAPPPLSRVTSAYSWKQLAVRLARSRPEVVVKAASARALDFPSFKGEASAEAIEVLCVLASNHAELVVSTICDEVLRLPHRLTLSSEGWQRLFATVDPSIPIELLQVHGVRLAREFAEFVPDPSVNDSGVADVHPLTESLLRDFGSDPESYRRFATARWNGRVLHGWAWEEPRRSQVERLIKAYRNHEIPALARWANEVESDHKAAEERERIEYAEDSRR